MWPLLLDMTKEESIQCLRNLELEAYAHLVSALRAQGALDADKRKLLKDSSQLLNIPQDRHKAEIRRAVNDEKLNTIAYHITGLSESIDDWAQEGRRTVPLLPRMAPQTAFSAIADEAAENANHTNKQLPPPVCTERKRLPPPPQPVQIATSEISRSASFRIPETPKNEDVKKRKLSICPETSSLAQHLLGPSKMSRTPQIYRQRTKNTMLKEATKLKPSLAKIPQLNGPKINIVQNITLTGPNVNNEETIEQIQNEINSYSIQKSDSNDFQRAKLLTSSSKINQNVYKQPTGTPLDKQLKICQSVKKQLPMTAGKSPTSLGSTQLSQKLIVVSNAQTIQSNSILQKTLSIPLVKNISVKNLEKFKIVTTSSPQLVSATNNLNSLKHKVVTVKANMNSGGKKVIPLSILNSKGAIKVLPIGGKIVGKTTTTTSSPLYIVNTVGTSKDGVQTTMETVQSPTKENGKSSVLSDILKASGVTNDDFDSQSLEEIRIPNNHLDDSEEIEAEPQATNQDIIIVQETDKEMEISEKHVSDSFIVQTTTPSSADSIADISNNTPTDVAATAATVN